MRIVFLGDVMGRSGRTAVHEKLPALRDRLKLDFVIANGENAAAGFGLTAKIADQLFAAGVDCITGGNHTFDQMKEIHDALNQDKRILRPVNYPPDTPGTGYATYDIMGRKKITVINAMARVFMNPLACPFEAVNSILTRQRLSHNTNAIIVDFHGEATSEKNAMGHFLDGRVSLVVGTHSHIPTADCQILNGGTAFQTDAGMCGDYDSVIGMQKQEPIRRFVTKLSKDRFTPARGPATLCGTFIETDDKTGLAVRIEPLRLGPRLMEHVPTLENE